MRRIAVLDAPSNLGLRPPTATSVPGCAKAPGALRDHGLLRRLNARDAGCLTPPRYDPGDWRPGDGVCHAPEISAYSRKLADRIGAILDHGEFPVVLGGDCSIVLGSALAMHRLGEAVGGRIGLVFVDGHSDFRHPGNASYVGAAAGEDLALVTGRGQTDLAAMEGRRPYYRDIDVVVMGIRAQDEYRLDLQAAGIVTRPVPTLRVEGAARSAQWARDQLVDCAGYWVHIDVDVLDPAVMPAVDAPEPGGIAFPELEILLAGLVESPHCLGVEITVFDPDYDPDGRYAEEITSAIVAGLKPAQLVDARPDLVAARRDLAGPGRLGRGRPAPGQRGNPATRPGAEPEGEAGSEAAAEAEADAEAVRARRVAAADDVRAAAGMSGGGSAGEAEEAAASATAPGVAAAGEAFLAGPAQEQAERDAATGRAELEAASDRAEFHALSRRAEVRDVFGEEESEVFSQGVGFGDASREDESAASPGEAELGDRDVPAFDGELTGRDGLGRPTRELPEAAAVPFDGAVSPDGAVPSDAAELPDGAVSALSGDAGPDCGDVPEPAGNSPAEAVDDHLPRSAADVQPDAADHPTSGSASDAADVPGSPQAGDPAWDAADGPGSDTVDDSGGASADGPALDAVEGSDAVGDSGGVPGGDPAADAVDGPASDAVDDPGAGPGDDPVRAPMRPLGSAPLLDSKPLPATMPGMLRPRSIEEFTLPAQRPAFEIGPEQPVDLG